MSLVTPDQGRAVLWEQGKGHKWWMLPEPASLCDSCQDTFGHSRKPKPISVIMRSTVLWETGCRIKNVHYRELVLHQGSFPGNDISSGKYCLYHLSLFASLEEVAIVMKCVNVLLFYIFVFLPSTSPSFLACFYISSWQW